MLKSLTLISLSLSLLLPASDEKESGELLGCWRCVEKHLDWLLNFEPERRIQHLKGRLEVVPVARYDKDRVVLIPYGRPDVWMFSVKEGILTLKGATFTARFERLDKVPPELELKPMPLGVMKALPEDVVKEIRQELMKRLKTDQEVRKKETADPEAMAEIDRDNTAWLKKTVAKHGWIGEARFGTSAANAAFLIVQHSMDLPLMMAALPWIEKDVRAKKIGPQPYALLFDRLQIQLGFKQRYGTQIGQNEQGRPIVLPLEDRSRVDEFRKEIGLFPLSEYLKFFEKMTGEKVKFADSGPPAGK